MKETKHIRNSRDVTERNNVRVSVKQDDGREYMAVHAHWTNDETPTFSLGVRWTEDSIRFQGAEDLLMMRDLITEAINQVTDQIEGELGETGKSFSKERTVRPA